MEYSERKKSHPFIYVLVGMFLGLIWLVLFGKNDSAPVDVSNIVVKESMYTTPISSVVIIAISGVILLSCLIYLYYIGRDKYALSHDNPPLILPLMPIIVCAAMLFASFEIVRIDNLSLMREYEFKVSNGYVSYVDGKQAENPKLDLNYYYISFDDTKKEAFLTRKEK